MSWDIRLSFMGQRAFSWLLANSLLRDFGYSTALDGWVLVEAGGTALVLAVVTVGFQAFRVVRVNPVDVIRDE